MSSETNTEQLNDKQIDKKSDESDAEDLSDMPELEDVINESKGESIKKNIVIEDKKPNKEVDSDGWLDVLDNGDLKKFVLKAGDAGQPRPERGCVVVIKLVTKLYDTSELVESECLDSFDLVLGESDLFQGIDLVIPLMEQKEVSRVVIKSRFAYGSLGKGSEIPPDATLDCEIHILSVEWTDEETHIPMKDRLRIGNRKKERGNFWYGREDYSTAIQCYKSAIKYLDANEEEISSVDELKQYFTLQSKCKSGPEDASNGSIPNAEIEAELKLFDELVEIRSAAFNNLAAAHMKTESFSAALKAIDSVIMVQPNNVKALFRKGKIFASKGETQEAIDVFKTALDFEPDSKTIAQELNKLINKRKKELVTERNLYKRMLELDKDKSCDNQTGITHNISKDWWLKWGLIGGAVTATAAVISTVCYKFVQ